MSDRLAIGVDAGGTKIAGVLVRLKSEPEILDRRIVDMPADDPEAALATIVTVGRALVGNQPRVRAFGIGAAGMVDLEGVMRWAPNVAWRNLRLAERVGRAIGLPTYADNDANVAAWGEFRFGAGREVEHMLLVTVGTGIGGGIVSEGRLFRGASGFAAEIGHIVVEPNGPRCGCGNLGCWEQVASGRAIGRLGKEAAARDPGGLLASLAGGDAALVDGPIVTTAAMRGDPVAIGVLAEVGRRLGQGIAGFVNALDPQLVVVGGGAVEAGDLLLEPARRAYLDAVEGPDHRPVVEIVAARMGNDAGAVGAADLALRRVPGS